MAASPDRRVSHRRAAELLYRTSRPTGQQIQRVAEFIATGELCGDSRGTTVGAVAEFASRAALLRQDASSTQGGRQQRNSTVAREVYQDTLKQYFLSVFLRRKMHHASKLFKRAVLAGQIVVLGAILLLAFASVRWAFPPLAEEQAAAVAWLEANTERFRVIRFHPTTYDENGRAQLWVEYHYTTPQGRGIDTRREFTVAEGNVVAVDSE